MIEEELPLEDSDFRIKDELKQKLDQSKRDAITDKVVLGSLMAHADGRRWIYLLLSRCHMFESTILFDGVGGLGSGHARTAFQEGERAIGLAIFSILTSQFPEEFIELLFENQSKGKDRARPRRERKPRPSELSTNDDGTYSEPELVFHADVGDWGGDPK